MLQRRLALAFLAFVAALPFAFVLGGCHTSTNSDGASASIAPSVSASSAQSQTPTMSSADVTSAIVVDAGVDVAVSAASSSHVVATPQQKCEAARRHFDATVARNVACNADSDCVTVQTGCGLPGVCGMSIAASGRDVVRRESETWQQMQCATVLVSPCPTCNPPTPPKCVSGKCK